LPPVGRNKRSDANDISVVYFRLGHHLRSMLIAFLPFLPAYPVCICTATEIIGGGTVIVRSFETKGGEPWKWFVRWWLGCPFWLEQHNNRGFPSAYYLTRVTMSLDCVEGIG